MTTMTHTDERVEEVVEEFDQWSNNVIEHESERAWAKDFIRTTLLAYGAEREAKGREESKIDENTSDGYHTFKELYEFRKLYNACLFNEWSKQGLYKVHKSWKHSDGEDCFGGGWFIVVATLQTGDISNHYEATDWSMFQCEVLDKAKEWDGHTAQDVAKRLQALTTPREDNQKEV